MVVLRRIGGVLLAFIIAPFYLLQLFAIAMPALQSSNASPDEIVTFAAGMGVLESRPWLFWLVYWGMVIGGFGIAIIPNLSTSFRMVGIGTMLVGITTLYASVVDPIADIDLIRNKSVGLWAPFLIR